MSDMNRDGQLWMIKELYGLNAIPPAQDYVVGVKATLVCAKGDGVLTPEERDWVVGRAAALRNPGYELAKTYAADEDLQDVLGNSSIWEKSGRRMIVYLAIKACSSDGEYHPDEREKVHSMAKTLGVAAEVVAQIEQQCVEEAEMRAKRIALLLPDGNPYEREA